MMEAFRLDSLAPLLAERFRQATSDARRRAAAIACEHAVAVTGVTGVDIELALSVLRQVTPVAQEVRQRLETRAAELDDQYFHLNEDDVSDRKHAALRAFSMARATTALAFAITDDDATLHEAIYESIAALDDPKPLELLIERALQPTRCSGPPSQTRHK
jgi:hypothetical protein